jgi:hypothetical protein
MYCISITKYFTALHQVWCSYYNYIGEAIRFKILWHHIGPFGSLSNHSFYFFMGAKASLSGPMCCAHLFRMLNFDYFYINLSFPIGWLAYSSWCNGTCINWYLFLPNSIMVYPCDVIWGHLITCLAFQEFNGVILSSSVVFFDGPTTQTKIDFASTHYTKTWFYDMSFSIIVELDPSFVPCLIIFLVMDAMFWCNEHTFLQMLCEHVFAHM